MRIVSSMTVACPQCKTKHEHDPQLMIADGSLEYVFLCHGCGLIRNVLDDRKVQIVLEHFRQERIRLEEESRLEDLRQSKSLFRT